MSLPTELINDILAYLGTRPLNEVLALFQAIHEQAQELPDEEEP